MSTPAEVRLARRVLRHELEAIQAHLGLVPRAGDHPDRCRDDRRGDAFRGIAGNCCDFRRAAPW